MNSIVNLSQRELDVVGAAGTCGQDVTGAIAAGVGVVGAALAPVSFGASLVAAGLFGLAAGIYAGEATQSCK